MLKRSPKSPFDWLRVTWAGKASGITIQHPVAVPTRGPA
jgi:hypothetical protein